MALLLLGAALIVAETAAIAQGSSPRPFLEGIYKSYGSGSTKGIDYSRPEVIRKHFAQPLAKAMVKDFAAAKKRGEVPALDGDPFVDAQDWRIANLQVEVKDASPRRATGVVIFTNAGEARIVTLDLVKTVNGWRIAEIKAPSGSLRDLYKLN